MHILIRLLLAALAVCLPPARADEAAVREASAALVAAWNRHDLKAWSGMLTDDAWYKEAEDFYERFKGRDKVVGLVGYKVESSDLQWDIVRVTTRHDGQVGVVLVERMSMLPKTDGKYHAVFTSDPSYARWRREADGRWRLAYFTSHKGLARAEILKDDAGGSPVAAAPAPAAPPARPKPPRGAPAYEPGEFTAFYGKWAQGCNNCHGRPPGLPSSAEGATRIVAIGAAAADGAALRAAMRRNPAMGEVLADPELTDTALEAVRRFLVDVRDGVAVVATAAGPRRALQLHNARSARDAPARIAVLRVHGPWRLVVGGAGGCGVGSTIAGQASCTVTLQPADAAGAATPPRVEWRFDATPELTPQARSLALPP